MLDLVSYRTDAELKAFARRFTLFTRECEKLMSVPTLGTDEELFGFSVQSAWDAYRAGLSPTDYAKGLRAPPALRAGV